MPAKIAQECFQNGFNSNFLFGGAVSNKKTAPLFQFSFNQQSK
jgi:hypothetical protein